MKFAKDRLAGLAGFPEAFNRRGFLAAQAQGQLPAETLAYAGKLLPRCTPKREEQYIADWNKESSDGEPRLEKVLLFTDPEPAHKHDLSYIHFRQFAGKPLEVAFGSERHDSFKPFTSHEQFVQDLKNSGLLEVSHKERGFPMDIS